MQTFKIVVELEQQIAKQNILAASSEKCLQTCTKCIDSADPVHAQIIICHFALRSYIQYIRAVVNNGQGRL